MALKTKLRETSRRQPEWRSEAQEVTKKGFEARLPGQSRDVREGGEIQQARDLVRAPTVNLAEGIGHSPRTSNTIRRSGVVPEAAGRSPQPTLDARVRELWPNVEELLPANRRTATDTAALNAIARGDGAAINRIEIASLSPQLLAQLSPGGAMYRASGELAASKYDGLAQFRSRLLSPKVRELVREAIAEETGIQSQGFQGYDYLVVGLPRGKVRDWDIDPTKPRLFSSMQPGTAELFGRRAAGRSGDVAGAVILVFPQRVLNTSSFAKRIDDMPGALEVVLGRHELEILAARAFVVEAPNLFTGP